MADAARNDNGSSTRLMRGSVASLLTALLLAAIFGLVLMWQKVLLQEDRQGAMVRVDEGQSAQIHALQVQVSDLIRLVELIRERQNINTKGVEVAAGLIQGIVALNAEQQYQIGLTQERLRRLERQAPMEGP
jgi:hypothetical protein